MRVDIGSHVYSSDGKDLGVVRYLVLDPADNRTKTAVIEKGLFLPRDIELPIEELVEGPEGRIQIDRLGKDVAGMPPFDVTRYTTPPATVPVGVVMPGYLWPTSAVSGTPAVGPAPMTATMTRDRDVQGRTDAVDDERQQVLSRLDRENAVITEGSDVISSDGQHVGTVERVEVDAASGRVISLVISRGPLGTKKAELPGTTIASVDDRVVYLNIGASEIDDMQERITPKAA